ncbi:MAG: M20/M25/M40 family metallo-hydrolase [Dehalococcoidia bacterium]
MVDQAVKDRVLGQVKVGQAVNLCSSLLKIPSFKTEETKVARFLANFFRRRGYEVDLQEVEPGRYQTVATLKGSGGGKSLMLNGHLDIDPLAMGWKRDPWTPSLEGDRLYGAGANNMKGGVTAIITAAEAIRKSRAPIKGDLVVACVVGELQGGIGTLHALNTGYVTDGAYVAEPTGEGDNIMTVHVGWVELAISTIGLSQHVSRAHKAIDAIEMMIRAIPAIKQVKFTYTPRPDLPDMPRVIVGTIIGGRGRDHDMRGPNFTCDYCTIIADVRTVPGQTAQMVKEDIDRMLKGLKAEDPTFEYEIVTPVPPHYKVQTVYMNPLDVPKDEPVVKNLENSYREVTGKALDRIGAIVTQSYAGNDSCHIWERGIPVCLHGAQSGRDVKGEPDSFVSVTSMVQVAKTYALAALNWCNQSG